ncbi:MAG: hypothetical protein ACXWQR_19375 [Ktedonobacterales bacterium]
MAATVQTQLANGATPTLANAETGIRYGRDDNQTSTATIPIPTATGTKYSYLKYLALVVTATSTTNITNRRINWATTPATGLFGFFLNQATYTQNNGTQGAAAGNYPADAGTNGATPASYTLMSTTAQLWDNTSVAPSSAARNGTYVQTVVGADFTYAGGGNSNTSLPSITLTYDEA